MKTKHQPGSVNRVSKSQVGAGWRIASHDEKPHWKAEVWSAHHKRWVLRPYSRIGSYYLPGCTYRVPVEEGDKQ